MTRYKNKPCIFLYFPFFFSHFAADALLNDSSFSVDKDKVEEVVTLEHVTLTVSLCFVQ